MTAQRRLSLVLAINLSMVLALLLVGLLARSLGLLAAGADYLGDALGAGLSLGALRISGAHAAHPRATAYAALANSGLLLTVTLLVVVEAARRLLAGAPVVHGVPVLAASLAAVFAMLACARILGDVGGDLSMESVMLDTVADAAAAVGVALSGTVMLLAGGVYWLDSAVALAIGLVVGYHAIRLLGRAARALRGGTITRS